MDFFAKRNDALTGGKSYATVSDAVREFYPLLSRLLEGTYGPDGSTVIPPFTLTLFPGEGEVRAAFTSKESNEAWFCTAGAEVAVLDAIEHRLRDGQLEPRRDKKAKGKPVF